MRGNKAILKFILAALLVCFATAKDGFDENLYVIKALLAVENARYDEATELYEQLYGIQEKLKRQAKRYNKSYPGELVHLDTHPSIRSYYVCYIGRCGCCFLQESS